MPFTPLIGVTQTATQSISVDIKDAPGNNVTSVKVIMVTDNDVRQFTLGLVAGTASKGTWGGQRYQWDVTDSYCNRYAFDIIVTNDKGNTQTGTIRANYICPK